MFPEHITLGELRKKLEIESMGRSHDCSVQVDITTDGEEYLHIIGDGLVSSIRITCKFDHFDKFIRGVEK